MTFRQSMRPHGFCGRVFGWLMDCVNARAHEHVLRRLDVKRTDAILEIGFGTGRLLRKLAKKAGFVAGIDPSELMLGDASFLPWTESRFDKAAALFCFQFWADPDHDLKEVLRVLKPGGLFVLILQRHNCAGPKWLPNPVSRSKQEIAGTLELLSACGFTETRIEGKIGSSPVITACKAVA